MEPLPPKLKKACFERDDWKCRYCGNRNDLHPHHLLKRSALGPHELWNLLTLCWKCHRAVEDRFLEITFETDFVSLLKVSFKKLKEWR